MPVDTRTWHVGIVGVSHSGLYLLERIRLEPVIQLSGVFDRSAECARLATDLGGRVWNSVDQAIADPATEILIFSDIEQEEMVAESLRRGKHLILDRPWRLSSAALRRINVLAEQCGRSAVVAASRRWSSSFLTAAAAARRSGVIHSIRYASLEQAISAGPRDQGVVREFGYDRLDQLLQLAPAKPVRVFARRFIDSMSQVEHGVLIQIEFADGCQAQIEIQTRSRLSTCTGWLLEGSEASFRNNRLYTTTADGEIIDEPFPVTPASDESFALECLRAWEGQSSALPSAAQAAEVVELIDIIQRQAAASFS